MCQLCQIHALTQKGSKRIENALCFDVFVSFLPTFNLGFLDYTKSPCLFSMPFAEFGA